MLPFAPTAARGDRCRIVAALPGRWGIFLACVWLSMLLGTWVDAEVAAEDFRIETAVYVADEEQPVSKNVTLFEAGVVYDFLEQPEQVAVFSKPGEQRPGRFILLDAQRQMRSELTTEQLSGMLDKIRNWATSQRDPLLRFTAQPDFQEKFDEKSGELSLSSQLLSYRIETIQPEEDGDTSQEEYLRFCDWYARLNSVVVGQMLPFPRLAVNQALAKHGRMPQRIHLSIPGDGLEIRAEHRFNWRLSKQDKSRIDEVRRQLQEFRSVSNAEYREQARN